jgi:site-specific recombinase XerD
MKPVQVDRKHKEAETIESPLCGYPSEFLDRLKGQHYSQSRIDDYGRCIASLSRVMVQSGIEVKNLNEDQVTDLVRKSDLPPSWKKQGADFMVRNFIEFLVELRVAKPGSSPVVVDTPRMRLRKDYEEYLRRQRGLTEKSIDRCWYVANQFLKFLFLDGKDNLSGITPEGIIKYIQFQLSRRKHFRDKTQSTHLRNLLLFLFKTGKTATNLAPSVPRIAQPHQPSLPRHLAPEQVETLISTVKKDTPTGRRNYAMVLLMARLGLRPTEVIVVQIDDIDWRKGEILIRGKGQLHDRMPLPQDVGKVLADYIQKDRKTKSRALFVTERAPRQPFHDAQILNSALKEAFIKTGLRTPVRYVGANVLRHSLAMKLMKSGSSLPEVGDVLRHRARHTTMIYAKVDIEGLRSVAQPWPVTGGAK